MATVILITCILCWLLGVYGTGYVRKRFYPDAGRVITSRTDGHDFMFIHMLGWPLLIFYLFFLRIEQLAEEHRQ